MQTLIRTFVEDYGWIHLSISLLGNLIFLLGSILFLPAWEGITTQIAGYQMGIKTLGVWLFIIGAALMLIGSIGRLLVDLYGSGDGRS